MLPTPPTPHSHTHTPSPIPPTHHSHTHTPSPTPPTHHSPLKSLRKPWLLVFPSIALWCANLRDRSCLNVRSRTITGHSSPFSTDFCRQKWLKHHKTLQSPHMQCGEHVVYSTLHTQHSPHMQCGEHVLYSTLHTTEPSHVLWRTCSVQYTTHTTKTTYTSTKHNFQWEWESSWKQSFKLEWDSECKQLQMGIQF